MTTTDSLNVEFELDGRFGPDQAMSRVCFTVPKVAASRSPFLEGFIEFSDTSANGKHRLVNLDPEGFRVYIEWLENWYIDQSDMDTRLLRNCDVLMYAHTIGTSLKHDNFADYVMDIMCQAEYPQDPDMHVFNVLFDLGRSAHQQLRDFIICYQSFERQKAIAQRKAELGIPLPSEDPYDPCRFHVHAPGRCYKSPPASLSNELGIVSARGISRGSILLPESPGPSFVPSRPYTLFDSPAPSPAPSSPLPQFNGLESSQDGTA